MTLCDLNCGFLPLFSGEVLITLDVCWGRTGSRGEDPSPTVMRGKKQEMGILQLLCAALQHPDFEQLLLHASLRTEIPYPCQF